MYKHVVANLRNEAFDNIKSTFRTNSIPLERIRLIKNNVEN